MILQLEHLTKSFGGRVLFADATLRLEEYDRLALVGPNGAGKTTLLRIISGEEDYDSGRIHLQRSELSKGAWFDRNHLPHIPEKLSIARQLLDAWLEEKA